MPTRPADGNWNVSGQAGGWGGGSSGGGSSDYLNKWQSSVKGAQPAHQGFWQRAAGDVGNTFRGVASGAIGTAIDVAKSPWTLYGSYQASGHVPFTPYKPGQEERANAYLQRHAPHLFGGAVGLAQTARDVGAGRILTPTARSYTASPGQNYSQHPFSAAVNDFANLSMLGGLGARASGWAAGAAPEGSALQSGLATTARGFNKAATLGGDVANVPAYPARAAGWVGRQVGRGAEAAASHLPAESPWQGRLATAAHPFQTALAPFHERQAIQAAQRSYMDTNYASGANGEPLAGSPGPVIRTHQQVAQALAPHGPHAFQALTLARTQAPETVAAVARMTPQDFATKVTPFYRGTVPAQEAFAQAHALNTRALSPEAQAAFSHANGLLGGRMARQEAQNLAGVGFAGKPPLSREQSMAAGPGPMPGAVARDPRTQALQAKLGPGTYAESARALADIANAPGRARPALLLGRHLTGRGVEGLPTTAAGLAESGWNPAYVRGGAEGTIRPTPRFGTTRGGSEPLPQVRNPLATRQTGEVPLSAKAQAGEQMAYGRKIASNLTYENLANDPRFAVRAADVGLKGRSGPDLVKAMREQTSPMTGRAGYEPWDPRNPGAIMDPASVKSDTPFLPSNVLKNLRASASPDATVPTWRKAAGQINRPFYAGNLALNPGWTIHRPIANAFMMTVGGGIRPTEAMRYLYQAGKDLKLQRSTIEDVLSPAAKETPLASALAEKQAGQLNNPVSIRHPIQAAYHAHDVGDRLFRQATYLWKKDQGATEAEANAFARKTMGDYRNLSPAEQTLKTAVPFYPWYRQTTQVLGRLARDNPARLAATLQASRFRPDAERNATGSAQGKFPIGGGLSNVAKLNPLYASPDNPLLSPAGFFGALNPYARLAYSGTTGQELGGPRPGGIYRPRGESGALKPGEILPYVGGQTSISRAAIGALRAPGKRYATGQPTGAPQSRLAAFRQALGTPWPEAAPAAPTAKGGVGKAGGWGG